jgi:3-hydroxyisobutyrate dehydrogenase-like beta-hydroxyacid dehydrogenase
VSIAIIGLGVMGRAAATRLREHGHELVVHDPAPGTAERAAAIGASSAASVEAAAVAADSVLLFLPGPAHVRAVVPALCAACPAGSVIVDHSTADPETAEAMAALALQAGLGWADAPVLGRPAAVGRWAHPVGQTPGALARVEPVLRACARTIIDVGGPGAGHMVKLLNQMMFGAINAMTAEMMSISDRLGLPPARLFEIISASEAGTVSNLFRELGQRIAEERYDDPTFSVALLDKDIRLGLAMARAAGAEPRLGAVVAELNAEAIEHGLAASDTSAMWTAMARAGT